MESAPGDNEKQEQTVVALKLMTYLKVWLNLPNMYSVRREQERGRK